MENFSQISSTVAFFPIQVSSKIGWNSNAHGWFQFSRKCLPYISSSKYCAQFFFRRPEKYPRQSEYTGAPVMMDKQSLYNQSFAPGPYDNFSMRSYSPGASYRGVATMPEIGYDNTGYGGTAMGGSRWFCDVIRHLVIVLNLYIH